MHLMVMLWRDIDTSITRTITSPSASLIAHQILFTLSNELVWVAALLTCCIGGWANRLILLLGISLRYKVFALRLRRSNPRLWESCCRARDSRRYLALQCLLSQASLPRHHFKASCFQQCSTSNIYPNFGIILARAMRDEGKTLQQIADALGYKSASSVFALLGKSNF